MESQSDLFLQRVYDTGVGVRQWLADGVRDCRRYSGNHPFWLAVYLGWYMCVSTHIYIYIHIMHMTMDMLYNDSSRDLMVEWRHCYGSRTARRNPETLQISWAAAIHSCWWFSWGSYLYDPISVGIRIQTATAENSPGLTSVTPISCNARRFQCEADMDGGRHGGTKP